MQFMRSETGKNGKMLCINKGRRNGVRKKRKMPDRKSVGSLFRISRREGLSH